MCIDCTRKWIGKVVQNFSSSSVRSRDKIARVRRAPLPAGPGFELQSSAVFMKLTIQLPSLLLVCLSP